MTDPVCRRCGSALISVHRSGKAVCAGCGDAADPVDTINAVARLLVQTNYELGRLVAAEEHTMRGVKHLQTYQANISHAFQNAKDGLAYYGDRLARMEQQLVHIHRRFDALERRMANMAPAVTVTFEDVLGALGEANGCPPCQPPPGEVPVK